MPYFSYFFYFPDYNRCEEIFLNFRTLGKKFLIPVIHKVPPAAWALYVGHCPCCVHSWNNPWSIFGTAKASQLKALMVPPLSPDSTLPCTRPHEALSVGAHTLLLLLGNCSQTQLYITITWGISKNGTLTLTPNNKKQNLCENGNWDLNVHTGLRSLPLSGPDGNRAFIS